MNFIQPPPAPRSSEGGGGGGAHKQVNEPTINNRLFPSCFEPHYEGEAKCKIKLVLFAYE